MRAIGVPAQNLPGIKNDGIFTVFKMKFKQQIYDKCLQLINEKIGHLNSVLKDLRETAGNETKSSAGDKYETARAMLQIEQENTGRQLNEAVAKKEQLETINITAVSQKAGKGALIRTNRGYFFISVAIGKIMVNEKAVIALSPQSPLGIEFNGSGINDVIKMNGTSYRIESIE